MYLLEQANQKGKLPERVVLTGHSRGAAAQILLARKIYLKYGDKIKITMNVSDPVPGPGDLIKKSRRIISSFNKHVGSTQQTLRNYLNQ